MSQPSRKGIQRDGLDAPFDGDEALKSNLIVEAQFLGAQEQPIRRRVFELAFRGSPRPFATYARNGRLVWC